MSIREFLDDPEVVNEAIAAATSATRDAAEERGQATLACSKVLARLRALADSEEWTPDEFDKRAADGEPVELRVRLREANSGTATAATTVTYDPTSAPLGLRVGSSIRALTKRYNAHDHPTYVEGCFRCDLSREEIKTFPSVQGYCPCCGGQSLFLAAGGYVTCSREECSEPDAASRKLESPRG